MKGNAKNLFLVLIALNILLLGAILGVFIIASGVAQQKSKKIAELKADLETNEQAIANYKTLQATLNNNKELEATSKKVLPTDKDQAKALVDLDKLSKETGIPVQQISFSAAGGNAASGQTITKDSGVAGVSAISVVLNINNTRYDTLLTFLKRIETTQRRMQVTTLAITPNSNNPNLLDKVGLTLDIYLKAGK